MAAALARLHAPAFPLYNNPGVAVPALALPLPQDPSSASNADRCTSAVLLDIVERAMHAPGSEWLFFREQRVGTSRRNGNVQRLDAFALNSMPHTGMKRVCYEVKASRSDFLAELKHPLKRRVGMRYSAQNLTGAPTAPEEGCVFTNGLKPTDKLTTVPPSPDPPLYVVP